MLKDSFGVINLTRYQKRSLLIGLKAIYERIKSGWTRGRYASNKKGEAVYFDSKGACRWCLLGAIEKEVPTEIRNSYAKLALKNVILDNFYTSLANFNDSCTNKNQVLQKINEAIRLVKE